MSLLERMAEQQQDNGLSTILAGIPTVHKDGDRHADLPIDLLDPWTYPDGSPQPFDEYTQEDLAALAKDIEQNGMTDDILVRPRPFGRYQIIAGHHRTEAHKLLGRATISATIRQMDDLTAEACLISSNLHRRKGNSPSSLGRIYLRLLTIQQQRIQKGQRSDLTSPNYSAKLPQDDQQPDLTSPNNSAKLRSDDEAAKSIGISGDTLRNYIRLLSLEKPLLDMVDAGTITPTVGFEITYLTEEEQRWLLEVIGDGIKVSVVRAKALHKASTAGQLTDADAIRAILIPAPAPKPAVLKIPADRLQDFFPPNTSLDDMEREIYAALLAYRKNDTTPASL